MIELSGYTVVMIVLNRKPLFVCALGLAVLLARDCAAQERKVDYGRDVRPILSDKCYKCHGPDANARKADLRLDQSQAAGEVLSRANPAKSKLVSRIMSNDPDTVMPPPSSKLSLSAQEKATLRAWVLQGGKYSQHWSFLPIKKPAPPKVNRRNWVKNEIDLFTLARLERVGLAPAQRASKERLIRRVSFDLIGLPPTLQEIDQFLADKSSDAYSKLIDRLLKKPQFGERLAANWLDVARYSDSYGYQVDRDRYVWPWRDWVIRSFNDNLPYDKFVTHQLAGDLLPNATDDQILATTFNRLHPQKVEGGSVPEEFRVEYVADRNHTMATAFMGLTLECARCHDHKYDPIKQREYYQLFAFFNNIDEAGLYSYFTRAVPTPTLLIADSKKKKQMAAVEAEIAREERKLTTLASAREAAFQKWLSSKPAQLSVVGQIKHLDFEKYRSSSNRSVAGKQGKAVQLSGDDGIGVGVGNFRRFQPFTVSSWLWIPDHKKRSVVWHRSQAWTDAGSRGYQLLLEDGRYSFSLIHFWPGNALRVKSKQPAKLREWVHLTVTYNGSSRANGVTLYVNGKPIETKIARDNLYKNITGGGGNNITIGQRMRDKGFTNGRVDEFRVFNRQLTDVEVAQVFDGHSLNELAKVPTKKLTSQQTRALRAYYLANVDADFKKQLAAVQQARQKRSQTVDGVREIMVMKELKPRRQSFVLNRGAYNAPTKPVIPDTPKAFNPWIKGQPRNRLGLAKWLTHPDHPLTARVAVNRYWRLVFGHGLVRTPEDFGSQGKPPTHPLLLDWLARDFIEHGWNVKRLMKQIVMSATYQQSSRASQQTLKADPDNLLLSRSPSYRWPAEMIRDHALAASGLLVRQVGGAPARPYDLSASFKPSRPDKGPGLYRRSVYTYWKRTAPAPVMMALDASKRDVCTVKRERTTSPIQAFVLLNGPQFVEAARVLGERLHKAHGKDATKLVVATFRVLTSRRPNKREIAVLQRLYNEQLELYKKNPKAAATLLKNGQAKTDNKIPAPQRAAAAVLALALMNYDDCVMKR